MTDDVGRQVLRDNYEQNVLLGNARAQEHAMVPRARAAHPLAGGAAATSTAALEFLPTDAELDAAGARRAWA